MIWKKKRVYADAAAATPMSESVKRELIRLLELFGNPGALHLEAVEAKVELEQARKTVADAIGAHADEIIFTSSGTEANNLAIDGVLRPLLRGGAVHAVASAIEHSSVLEPLRSLRQDGLRLTELPVSSAGLVSIKDAEDALLSETALVSIQYINSEIGTVQPIKDIAKAVRHARKRQQLPLYFHCDAAQAPLWKTLNVEQLGVDLLTLDGQKISGPKGVGALYVRRHVKVEGQMRGGGQERGLRSGTENVPLAGSFAVALRDSQARVGERVARIAAVRTILMREIQKRIPDVALNGAVGDERVANNLNLSIPGLDGQMAVIALSAEGVAASTRSACDTSDERPSHVLIALGLSREAMQSAIRFTLLPDATPRDAKRVARALADVAQRYKK